MPPRTRSNKMARTSAEGKDMIISNPKAEGDLLRIMTKMMEDLKQELKHEIRGEVREGGALMEAQMTEFKTRWKSNHNTLVGASRSVTPKSDHLHLKEHVVFRDNGGYREYVGKRCGMNVDDSGDYESRYHEDGLDREGSGERAPESHGKWHSRRVRDHVSHKGFERPIEEDVSYRARLRPTYRHGGVDTNQMGTPSSHLTTSSSFHFSHEPLNVYGNVLSSMSLNQISRGKEREREKGVRVKLSLKS